MRTVLTGAVEGGLRTPPVRWLMIASAFTAGTGIYVFYALQPFLLQLYGRPDAYSVAGLAAALVAAAQITGGLLARWTPRLFHRRTSVLIVAFAVGALVLLGLGLVDSLAAALILVAVWSLVSAIATPVRQAFLNGLIPSAQRATVLSFDSLMGSAGGVVTQPALGRVADLSGYPASYVVSAAIQAVAVPFAVLARRERAESDPTRPTS